MCLLISSHFLLRSFGFLHFIFKLPMKTTHMFHIHHISAIMWCVAILLSFLSTQLSGRDKIKTIFIEMEKMKRAATRYGIHKTFHIVRILSFLLSFSSISSFVSVTMLLLLSHLFLCVAQSGKQPVIYHTLLEILPFLMGKNAESFVHWKIPCTIEIVVSFPIPVRT